MGQSTRRFEITGDTAKAEIDGFTITARLEPDYSHGAPWEEEDGHGEVSNWTTRGKRPGEMILNESRRTKRYYDYAGAVRIARRDRWCVGCDWAKGMSAGAIAAKAAMLDYNRLRQWCANDWNYVCVVLSVAKNGITLDRNAAAIGGCESDAQDYLLEMADEMLDQALERGREILHTLIER